MEVGFTTIGNCGQAMMIAANVAYALQFKLFREAYACATLLDGMVVIEINREWKTRIKHWIALLPRWSNALRTWGESGVVNDSENGEQRIVMHVCRLCTATCRGL